MSDLIWLLAESLAIALLVVGLFHGRRRLGIAPLFVALGTFQMAQVLLASTFYVELAPGWIFSPGSTVLFPASLFAILLLYIHDDADRTRELVYGLVVANLTLAVLLAAVHWQMGGRATVNLLGVPPSLFAYAAINLVSGTVLLWIDVLLLVIFFEHMPGSLRHRLWVRFGAALALVLTFDSLFFVSLNFGRSEAFGSILASSVLGKLAVALVYAAAFSVYESRVQQPLFDDTPAPLRDIFHTLTFQERYQALRRHLVRDPLTGSYNRRFLQDFLPTEIERARRLDRPLSLLIIDLDHFKAVNDRHGHLEGDRVLVAVAEELAARVRAADAVARFGGEEFAVILPNTPHEDAITVAENLRRTVREVPRMRSLAVGSLSATVGVASYPEDGEVADALLVAADVRLYEGKEAGRDRVVGAFDEREAPPAAASPTGQSLRLPSTVA